MPRVTELIRDANLSFLAPWPLAENSSIGRADKEGKKQDQR